MIVKGITAAEVKVIPFTPVAAETKTVLTRDNANVAVSPDPLGTVPDDQFDPVFQSVEGNGKKFHVPLPAKVVLRVKSKNSSMTAERTREGLRLETLEGTAFTEERLVDVRFFEEAEIFFMLFFHWRTPAPKTLGRES